MKKRFLLVSFSESNMSFEYEMYGTIDEARCAMRESIDGVKEDYIDAASVGDTSAYIVGAYTKAWKTIEVK